MGSEPRGANTMARIDGDIVQPKALEFGDGGAKGSDMATRDEPMDVKYLIRHWDGQAGQGDWMVGAVGVAEVCSPERVVGMARRMGTTGGSSIDVTTYDIDGRPWDFSQAEMRRRGRARILKE